ncbi:type 1 glutamine amidotransferase domain-containing protein [Clostridium polynesiense]|uniref:type 1 glutamine amidotransferase domain-containing protein n=1 Tax=Clostridium polynesiense TaxID=1325933 RepID=UPI00058AE56A|nr:type 1 glutamine amidotransferase domain-containing protein [Clostridium polynesiense]
MKENKKVLCFVAELFEDLELWYPVLRLREEGIEVKLVGREAGKVYKGKHGVSATSDLSFSEVNAQDYDGIIIPGGYAPDKLRVIQEALDLVKTADDMKKPIGQICHAGQVTVSAKILAGRKVTSVKAIKDDMVNSGAEWTDEEVVIDRNLVSSRTPSDLPAYVKKFIEVLNMDIM